MAIYITGDIHSNPERLSNKNFKRQGLLPLTKGDIVLLCGDFGLPWAMDKYDKHWLEWLSERPATVAFVDGNHENFDLLNNCFGWKVEDIDTFMKVSEDERLND